MSQDATLQPRLPTRPCYGRIQQPILLWILFILLFILNTTTVIQASPITANEINVNVNLPTAPSLTPPDNSTSESNPAVNEITEMLVPQSIIPAAVFLVNGLILGFLDISNLNNDNDNGPNDRANNDNDPDGHDCPNCPNNYCRIRPNECMTGFTVGTVMTYAFLLTVSPIDASEAGGAKRIVYLVLSIAVSLLLGILSFFFRNVGRMAMAGAVGGFIGFMYNLVLRYLLPYTAVFSIVRGVIFIIPMLACIYLVHVRMRYIYLLRHIQQPSLSRSAWIFSPRQELLNYY
jgi:hypothetical protein